jgi:hypothetical protein
MSRFLDLISDAPAPAPEPAPKVVPVMPVKNTEIKRARTNKGHFVKDDPATPENESWVGGIAPTDS